MSVLPSFEAPLEAAFYERHADEVARDLLGCYLVRRIGRSIVGGRIVEVEAYGGPGDPGSHADRAPSGRARIMFGPPGVAYVYFTYGMHFCLNAVCDPPGRASAVLIRALEPVWGIARMRRGAPPALPETKLAAGPGRVCRALGIDGRTNGADLVRGSLRILPGPRGGEVCVSPRIGLSRDDGRLWRFSLASQALSRPPGGEASRSPSGSSGNCRPRR